MRVYDELSEANFDFIKACHGGDLQQAVHDLHRAGICHTDVKPDNVMFDPVSKRFYSDRPQAIERNLQGNIGQIR